MTAVVPSIHVYEKKNPTITQPGMAGKIAVIGAFNTEETSPKIFETVDEAQTSFGNDDTFNGCSVVKDLFVGASSLLCVNTTTWTGSGSSKTADKTMSTTKLSDALAKIKGEDFDILFVAEVLTDTYIPIITAFLDECFEMKCPAGFTGFLAGQTASANVTSAGLAGDHCYGLITQTLEVDGVTKTNLQSIAYYTGIIAGLNVGNTTTMKAIGGITGLGTEYSFETGGDGKTYVEAGITVFKAWDRFTKTFYVVNAEQPNGYDLYINRVRDFVVGAMSLHQFLGERNRTATHNEIDHELASVKQRCVDGLDLLEDIGYRVEKKDVNCVDVYIDSLVFAGLITRIDVYLTIKVE